MELGIIGLGKMGGNMAERLRLAGHKVVGFDFNKDATAKLTADGGVGVNSLEDLAKNLQAPRAIWIMVPEGKPVDDTINGLKPFMQKGDIFIDGGNSNYKDSQRRYERARALISSVGMSRSGTMIGIMPAACAARMPLRESSTARHSSGATSSSSAARRNRSGKGLPRATSSRVTTIGKCARRPERPEA